MRFSILFLISCSDFSLWGKEAPPGREDAAGDARDTGCDGVEEDVDQDGITCLDGSCDVSVGADPGVSDAASCESGAVPAADPWRIELAWEFTVPEHGCNVTAAADVDQDGSIEILCSSQYPSTLYAVNGTDGSLRWSVSEFDALSKLSVGDLDGDGGLEIVGFAADHRVHALDPDGTRKWISSEEIGLSSDIGTDVAQPSVEVADLDGDGTTEVVTRHGILAGADGNLVALLDMTEDGPAGASRSEIAIGDLDGDGRQEIIVNWQVWDRDGRVLWTTDAPSDWRYIVIPTLVQADADAAAELVWFSEVEIFLADTDGSLLWELPAPFLRETSLPNITYPSLTCGGDLDGDGLSELLVADQRRLYAWTMEGDELWHAEISDDYGFVRCSLFDFDLDGFPEVVSSDADGMFILDGLTGTRLLDVAHRSLTVGENHLVLDVDGDGSVEIVLGHPVGNWESGGYAAPITVYRHPDRAWPPGAPIWGSETYSGTSVWPDGEVPRVPDAPWLTTKMWRGQPSELVWGSDLRPEIVDACVSACASPGEARVAVRLVNLGPQDARAGATLAAYTVDSAGARTLRELYTLDEALPANAGMETAWEFAVPVSLAEHGLVFVAGDDGTGAFARHDCDGTNDEVSWTAEACAQ